MHNLSLSQLTELQQQFIQLQQSVQAIGQILGDQTSQSHVPPLVKSSLTRPTRKRCSPKLTYATFRYRYWEQHPKCVTRLYQCLLRAQWIAPDTDPDDFSALFEGNETPARIKWTGTSLQLAYLIRLLTERQYIIVPKGVGIWTCVYNHFVNKNNRQFPKLNSLHTPQKSKMAISQIAELLNPKS